MSRRGNTMFNTKKEDFDYTFYCPECGSVCHTWMGMSMVQCPSCKKVF